MNILLLKKIGLNDKEIKIYLMLLEMGSSSVRAISDNTNLNRGTVYDILKKLINLGLASYYHKETKQKFVAENPEKLLKILVDKEQELKKSKTAFVELIPQLKSLQNKEGDQPITKLYEGRKGIRYILDDVLTTLGSSAVKEYYIYSATNASDDINNSYPDFSKERIKRNIKVKAISLSEGGGMHGLDERKWLGSHEESATFVIIYKNKCAFISRDTKGDPVGVIIENKAICDTQRIIFSTLWKLLK